MGAWSRRRGSNPHGTKYHWILSPARLPVPPLRAITNLLIIHACGFLLSSVRNVFSLNYEHSMNKLDFLCRVHEIALACDVVAVKDVARLVAGNFHANRFGNPGAHHVADGAPAQIVKEQ